MIGLFYDIDDEIMSVRDERFDPEIEWCHFAVICEYCVDKYTVL